MCPPPSKPLPTSYPEFAVRCDAFNRYFDKPLPSSTFHDLVKKGKIVPMKGLRGFYRLNESLRRMGLREVSSLPECEKRSTEDILRLAFSIIDPVVFPPPAWFLSAELLDAKLEDYVRLLAGKHLENVAQLQSSEEKLAYFGGVLDCQMIIGEQAVSSGLE